MRYTHLLRSRIYKRKWHLAVTFLVIVAPFLFILFFSRLTGVETKSVFADLAASFGRILVAYIIAAVLGVLFATLLSTGKIGDLLLPLFDVLQSFPSFAFVPLFMLWFGAGSLAAIIFLVITMLWPILFSMLSAIRLVRKDLEEASFVFGARGWKKFFYFTIPVSFPGFVTGSIVGIGEGWEGIVGAEIIGISPGIGGFLNGASLRGDMPVLAFGVIALLLFIFTLNKLIWLPLLKKSHDYSHE